ncbi:MAG: ATP-dependent helicase [Desulfobacteraceae bacterium]|nr:MAG: ATP-dependent helicase [Desulfobacteraceae bacterium]
MPFSSKPKNFTEHQAPPGYAKSPRIDYAEVLNPAQLEAVAFDKGPLLVIAGAGSGKTRTLTHRVARLVESGVSPKAVLLLSFTRKASQEMLKRASQLLDRRCQEVSGGTFHSFASSVLHRYAGAIGFGQGFSIIDRSDSEDLIAMIRKELSSNEENRHLPRKSTLASLFSRSINKALSLEEVIYEEYPHFSSQRDLIAKIWMTYGQRKREHHFLDYDDLLVYLQSLLSEHEDIRERLSGTYDYIMVDEYQDTNLIQAQIISLLAGQRRNVMVVGDDAQSIYAFRGANYKNIINFPEQFPGTRVIKLEENYRSLQPILDFSNALIAPAADKYSKCLFTRQGGGQLPVLVAASGENAQSRYVVREIARLKSQGVLLDKIAVLFRASFHSFDLELELSRASIPFMKFGGFKFTESAHIKDVIAHLRIFAAPRDRLSWQRVLLLVEKIGPRTAQRIYEAVAAEGCGAPGLLKAKLNTGTQSSLKGLRELIAAIGDAPHSLVRWGEMVLKHYLPALKARHDDYPRRVRDIEQLLTIMERYDRLEDFLTDMALEPPSTSIEDRLAVEAQTAGRLTLSTIHSAKGLEWDSVFIIWALDGRFPSVHALNRPDALEEERRLMYVAATRAQRVLHITYPVEVYDRTTQSVLYEPSRFLEAVPEDILERRFYSGR